MNKNQFVEDLIDIGVETGKTIKDTVNKELNRNGYDNLGEFVESGVKTVLDQNGGFKKPYSPSSKTIVRTRYEYMNLILSTLIYPTLLGNEYVTSYRNNIAYWKNQFDLYPENLLAFENDIARELNQAKKDYKSDRHRSLLAKIDALTLLKDELLYSKKQLMHMIIHEVSL